MKSERRLYQISGTSGQVEQQITALHESDRASEEAASEHQSAAGKEFGRALLGSLPFAAICWLGYNFINKGDAQDIIVLGSLLLGIVVFLYFIARAIKASNASSEARLGDIDDHLYEGLFRLHSFLKIDCTDATVYDYEIDFSDPQAERFLLRSEPYRGGGRESHYRQTKLKARVKLRDGTSLKLQFDQLSRIRAYSKTNARGKVKSKYKTKSKDLMRIDLGLNQAVSPEMASTNEAGKKVRVAGNRVTVIHQTVKRHRDFSVEPLLELAVETFQRVRQPSP